MNPMHLFPKIPGKAVVVFSGGQDSTTCLYWALRVFDEVEAVTFFYQQRHHLEVEAAKQLAKNAGVRASPPGCLGDESVGAEFADEGGSSGSLCGGGPGGAQQRGAAEHLCAGSQHGILNLCGHSGAAGGREAYCDGRLRDRFLRVSRLPGHVRQEPKCDGKPGNGRVLRHPYAPHVAGQKGDLENGR